MLDLLGFGASETPRRHTYSIRERDGAPHLARTTRGPGHAIPARQPGLQPPRAADTECCRSVLGIRANLKHTVEVELDFNYK